MFDCKQNKVSGDDQAETLKTRKSHQQCLETAWEAMLESSRAKAQLALKTPWVWQKHKSPYQMVVSAILFAFDIFPIHIINQTLFPFPFCIDLHHLIYNKASQDQELLYHSYSIPWLFWKKYKESWSLTAFVHAVGVKVLKSIRGREIFVS